MNKNKIKLKKLEKPYNVYVLVNGWVTELISTKIN